MARVDGRFRLLDKPNAYPFADIVNNTPEGPVFDLGVDLEMRDGVVYIKAEHVQEMAEQLGMLSAQDAEDLRAENLGLTIAINAVPDKIEKFTDGINALVRSYHDDLSLGDYSTNVSGDEELSGSERKESSGDNLGDSNDASNAFGQIFGLNLGKGPNDVPAGSGNDSSRKSAAGR